MRPPGPRALAFTVLVALAGAVAVALLLRGPDPSLDARVQAVSEQLRCPTCVSQSVAESDSPMAESMRHTARRQLAAGADEDEVVEWFRARYGDTVVLRPRGSGLGVVLWLGPVLALVVGAALAASVAVRTRRRGPAPVTASAAPDRRPSGAAVPVRRLLGVAVLLAAVGVVVPWAVTAGRAREPAATVETASAAVASETARRSRPPRDAAAWAALARDLETQQRYGEAAQAWSKALDRRPRSAAVRTRLAFDLLRAGRPAAAARSAVVVARRPGDHGALALLVLGLARRADGDPRAPGTLRRFLDLAPHHPAAGEVRRLLNEDR